MGSVLVLAWRRGVERQPLSRQSGRAQLRSRHTHFACRVLRSAGPCGPANKLDRQQKSHGAMPSR